MKTKETSKQEKLDWFNNQQAGNKVSLVNYYLGKTDYIATDTEIELIYDSESRYFSKPNQKQFIGNTSIAKMVDETIHPEKYNQKQFKQFDAELFKAYINKFSDEDKVNALKVLTGELPNSNFKYYILKWFSI